MADSCFADRVGDLIDLTPAERAVLAGLEERSRPLRRGAVLVRENDPQSELFVLTRGTMMAYVLLDDGSRQILRFLFPGDMMGFSALVYRRSVETIAAVTECTVSPFDRGELTRIVADHPRLAGMLMVMNQRERVALTDRLAALGRTSAKARVAALLLEIRHSVAPTGRTPTDRRATDRMGAGPAGITQAPADHAPADQTGGFSFALGLTQEEIGDATGLTAVHVNRMLRQLEEERLIARENGRVTLLDEAALARIGNYMNRAEGFDLAWLPAPR